MSTKQYPRLIDQLQIKHEPRGLLGRFFLHAERDFALRGLTLHLAPMDELWRAYERQPHTWNGLAPLLDTRLVDIPSDEAAVHLVLNRGGDLVGICSSRLINLSGASLQAACDDLSFFFGDAADKYRAKYRCELTAPSAKTTFGRLNFFGGMWVDPRFRSSGIASILQDVGRFYGVTQWSVDHEMLILSAKTFTNEQIRERYHSTKYEQGLSLYVDGQPLMANGVVCLSKYSEMLSYLGNLMQDLGEEQSTSRRDDQKSVATG